MTTEPTPPYVNQWGEEILDEYTETATSATDPMYDSVNHWQLIRPRRDDYDRREFGRHYFLNVQNRSRAQSFRTTGFTLDTAKALRDMLTAAIQEAEGA